MSLFSIFNFSWCASIESSNKTKKSSIKPFPISAKALGQNAKDWKMEHTMMLYFGQKADQAFFCRFWWFLNWCNVIWGSIWSGSLIHREYCRWIQSSVFLSLLFKYLLPVHSLLPPIFNGAVWFLCSGSFTEVLRLWCWGLGRSYFQDRKTN